MGLFFMFSVVASSIFFQVMISLLKKNCLDLDFGAVTPSDFCLKIKINLPFTNYSSLTIQTEVINFIYQYFPDLSNSIVYANPVYLMTDLLGHLKALKVAKENKIKIDAYIKRMGITTQ
jgi:hypothetical protein